MSDALRQDLIDAGLILSAEGQGDFTRGHISVRTSEDASTFLMKPHTFGFDEMTMDNIVVCDGEGNRVSGGPRHSEVFIHSEIFKVRPDVQAIIHAHPVHAVALSATGQAVLPISQPAASFYYGVPYYTDTIDLIRSADMGAGVAKALGSCKAVLMRNHGVAVVGRSIAEAVILSLALENACQIQLLCMAAGGPGQMFPPDDIQRLYDKISRPDQFSINFEYLRRKVKAAQRR